MTFESNPLSRLISWWAAALGVVLVGLAGCAAMDSRKPTTHTVTIDATRFEPAVSTVSVGDTGVWINQDIIPHTATSQPGGFDSGAIAPGKSWKYVPARTGEFAYICTFHPTMKAMLRVE